MAKFSSFSALLLKMIRGGRTSPAPLTAKTAGDVAAAPRVARSAAIKDGVSVGLGPRPTAILVAAEP